MRIARSSGQILQGRRGTALRVALVVFLVASGLHLHAEIAVRLVSDPPGPVPVGTMITFSPELTGSMSEDLWYRYRVREEGGTFRVIRDYGPSVFLEWTSIDQGRYEVELSIRDREGEGEATAVTPIELTSRVADGQAVISSTAHPLVYLYSASCPAGSARARLETDGSAPRYSSYRPCFGGSVNVYLAGLSMGRTYSVTLEVTHRNEGEPPPAVSFTTVEILWGLPLPKVVLPGPAGTEGLLLQSTLYLPPVATDMEGELVWFGPGGLTYLTHPGAGGTFWGLATSNIGPAHDAVRQFDLAGMTVRETNAARVNEQLALLGHRPISGFHHEARPLPGDRLVVLGTVEQILTDVQGPGPLNILGDMILVLDSEMQVEWAWDAFDHLDVTRVALLGETCLAVVGCPSYYLTADANDWTHGNSVALTADGALLYSARHQDWVLKIDYANGTGSGAVIWRLGKDGDFVYQSDDPYPWFSHQHDAHVPPGENTTIVLFDNSNTRVAQGFGNTSRGQAIELDEASRVARLRLNADLGVLAPALGSAQQLQDGGYHFNAGLVFDPATPDVGEAFAVHVDPAGNAVSSLRLSHPVYRSFRLRELHGTEPPKRRRPAQAAPVS